LYAAALFLAVLAGVGGFAPPLHAAGFDITAVERDGGDAKAPGIKLKDLSGIERSLSEFRGKVVVVHFWATWCEPCKEEFPALGELWRRLGPGGFEVVAVAVDSRKRVARFVREYGVEFPVLIDQYGGAMRSYRVGMIPVSVVIGRDGMVVGTVLGPRDYMSPEAIEFFEALVEK
jgi:peroxiredoxin